MAKFPCGLVGSSILFEPCRNQDGLGARNLGCKGVVQPVALCCIWNVCIKPNLAAMFVPSRTKLCSSCNKIAQTAEAMDCISVWQMLIATRTATTIGCLGKSATLFVFSKLYLVDLVVQRLLEIACEQIMLSEKVLLAVA